MDVYTERTIELMEEYKFNNYINLMAKFEAPSKNKNTLILLKIKELQEEAKQQILKEAADRRLDQEKRNAKL